MKRRYCRTWEEWCEHEQTRAAHWLGSCLAYVLITLAILLAIMC